MINHRGPEFAALMARIDRRMRVFFGTEQEVILLTAAGTGGLEAPSSTRSRLPIGCSPCRRARSGSLREDRQRVWRRRDAPRDRVGSGCRSRGLRAHLAADADYRAVLLTHNETSTGVTNPVAALAAVARSSRRER